MNDDRSLERAARSWVEIGPTLAPDRPVEAALLQIQTTPQERDLRIPWRLPIMNPTARLAGAALVVVVAIGVIAFALRPSSGVGSTQPTPTPTPGAAAPSSAVPTVFDTRTVAGKFALGMKITLPSGWKPVDDIVGDLWLANAGYPEVPESAWWGPELLLVEEAQIHDPSDVVSSAPATADQARFVAWPADFFAYVTALPGVSVVSGPEPITIGGVTGTQIVVTTPAMHPLVWLKGDYTWLGGGKTGVEPAMKRWFVVLKTGGHTLFMDFREDPAQFDARRAEFLPILESITFK